MLLYIHIPFCASKCGYCAFNSVVDSQELYGAYVKALCKDITYELAKYKNPVLSSVFIGGGTPNILDSRYYEAIFASFSNYVQEGCEISIESNVNFITQEWCKQLRAFGANRISVGVQSFETQKLVFLEREHNVDDIFTAFESIVYAGFDNISCDMIYDTPLDSLASLESEWSNLALLPLNHISAYSLSIDEDSRFATINPALPQESLSYEARAILAQLGFVQYEVSNYAKDNAYCAHNLGYWEAREYIGVGAGAYSRIGNQRLMATKNPASYIKNPHFRLSESLNAQDLELEEIMLGLRCKSGVRYELLKNHKNFKMLLQTGKILKRNRGGDMFVVACDLFLADELALWLS